MRPKRSGNTDAQWAALVRDVLVNGSQGRPQGEGWRSGEEFANAEGLSAGRGKVVLNKLHAQGKVEAAKGKIGRSWVTFYRPKQK